ncbi:hypothetical protein [Priestia megaterium]|uniref:hypothetical protein n=1 Tax=Priestia megaterium TaxID=1404 RepID=UPI003CFCDF37
MFYLMKRHFQQTGEVMDPHVFAAQFLGAFSTVEGVAGILMFDEYLNSEARGNGATG